MDTLPEMLDTAGRHSFEHLAVYCDDVGAFLSAQAEVAIQVERRRIRGYQPRHAQRVS